MNTINQGMRRLTITFVISAVIVSGLIILAAYYIYKVFSSISTVHWMQSLLGNPYIFFPFAGVMLVFIVWSMSGDYRNLMKYYRSAAHLGLKINFGDVTVFYNTGGKNINFDAYFRGGATGEAEINIKDKKVKIMNLYQPGSPERQVFTEFFNQGFGVSKLICVFETDFNDKNAAFRIKKGTSGDPSTTKKASTGNDYALLNFPGRVSSNSFAHFDGDPSQVYGNFSDNFLDVLDKLPGENMLVAQNGKIRLVHKNVVNIPELIKHFAESLIVMLNV